MFRRIVEADRLLEMIAADAAFADQVAEHFDGFDRVDDMLLLERLAAHARPGGARRHDRLSYPRAILRVLRDDKDTDVAAAARGQLDER